MNNLQHESLGSTISTKKLLFSVGEDDSVKYLLDLFSKQFLEMGANLKGIICELVHENHFLVQNNYPIYFGGHNYVLERFSQDQISKNQIFNNLRQILRIDDITYQAANNKNLNRDVKLGFGDDNNMIIRIVRLSTSDDYQEGLHRETMFILGEIYPDNPQSQNEDKKTDPKIELEFLQMYQSVALRKKLQDQIRDKNVLLNF